MHINVNGNIIPSARLSAIRHIRNRNVTLMLTGCAIVTRHRVHRRKDREEREDKWLLLDSYSLTHATRRWREESIKSRALDNLCVKQLQTVMMFYVIHVIVLRKYSHDDEVCF